MRISLPYIISVIVFIFLLKVSFTYVSHADQNPDEAQLSSIPLVSSGGRAQN